MLSWLAPVQPVQWSPAGWLKTSDAQSCCWKPERTILTPAQLPDAIRNGSSSAGEAIGSPHSWSLRGILSEEQGETNIAQGKVIGGSGSINGQVFLRGIPEDFDLWASLGNAEWSYDKVLPSYRKSETDMDIHDDFHGDSGPLPIVRRGKTSLGRRYSGHSTTPAYRRGTLLLRT